MIGRLLLLASAYSPLPLLIGVRIHNARQMWLLFAVAAVLALALPVWAWIQKRQTEPQTGAVQDTSETADELAAYLLSYILPFASLSAPGTRDLVAVGLFGVLLAAVYVQSGRLALNPWLLVFNVQVRKVRFDGTEGLLIARRQPSVGDDVDVVRLAKGLWMRVTV